MERGWAGVGGDGGGFLGVLNKEENVAVFGDVSTSDRDIYNNTGKLIPHHPIGHTEGVIRNGPVCNLGCEQAIILLCSHTNTHRLQAHFHFHTNTQAKSLSYANYIKYCSCN